MKQKKKKLIIQEKVTLEFPMGKLKIAVPCTLVIPVKALKLLKESEK